MEMFHILPVDGSIGHILKVNDVTQQYLLPLNFETLSMIIIAIIFLHKHQLRAD